jgi:cellobiose transport system permease protein
VTHHGTTTLPASAAARPRFRPDRPVARRRRGVWSHWPQYLAIAPFYLLFAVFGLFPVLFSFYLTLQRWDGIGQMTFVGLDNFRYLLSDADFWLALRNTVLIFVMSTVPTLALGLVLAVLINAAGRLKGFYRMAFFIPNITSTVAVAIFFGALFAKNYGLVNAGLHGVGLPMVDWLRDPWGMKVVIAVLTVWQWAGYNAIIYLAGLQTISSELYEQARIDGAGPVQIFFRLTLPLLRPFIVFTVVMSTIGGLQTFTEPAVLVGNGGGVSGGALTMVLYFYQEAFTHNDYGYGATIAAAVFVIVTAVTLLNWLLTQRERHGAVPR